MPDSMSEVKRVFLCHSSGDKVQVRDLYQRLRSDGFHPWLDEEDLLPGQDWKQAIATAVRSSVVVLVCLSKSSIAKTGFVQREIKDALDVADEQPDGSIFLIPVRLEDCDVPQRLCRWHWVNLFDKGGYDKLLNSLRVRIEPVQSSDVLPVQLNGLQTGPLTISAVLKGPERQFVTDAYPIGEDGVHFVFSLFNGTAFDFLLDEIDVDVLAYAPLNLDHLLHGVGATAVRRYYRATILPERSSYVATYAGPQGEFVMIPPGKSEGFDVEISTRTEGLYDVCLRVRGGSAGKGFNKPLDSTERRVAFFDRRKYKVDRGGGRMLTYDKYSREMNSGCRKLP
jgi:hypothetical protein